MKPDTNRDVARLVADYAGNNKTAKQLKRLFAVPDDSEDMFGHLLAKLDAAPASCRDVKS